MNFGKLVSFDGRINRSTFWKISLINIGVMIVLGVFLSGLASASDALGVIAILVGLVVYLGLSIVSLATGVKRWHDRNKSGWWSLISFVPVIGGIWALVETGFLAGDAGINRFGAPSSGSPFDGDAAVPVARAPLMGDVEP